MCLPRESPFSSPCSCSAAVQIHLHTPWNLQHILCATAGEGRGNGLQASLPRCPASKAMCAPVYTEMLKRLKEDPIPVRGIPSPYQG